MNILYHMPTKVIMGEDCVRQNAALLRELGKKALIVTGMHSSKVNGSLDDVEAVLAQNGQSYAIYDKVMSNPTIACVYDGAAFARQQKADFIVAIGGGSPMDAAKAIALLASQNIPQDKLFSGQYGANIMPMVHIPTTAGTGSEVTQYAILTNNELQTKSSIASSLLFPKYAFLDARYMSGLSRAVSVNTAIDALSHLVEGMLTKRANALTNVIAAEGIKEITLCFEALSKNALTINMRERLLYASMLGGIVIANTGTTALHAMGYPLTYFRNIDHGRANGLLMPSFFEFLERPIPDKITDILMIMGLSSTEAFKHTLAQLLGDKERVTKEELEKYSIIACGTKNIANTAVPPTADDVLSIYRRSFLD